MAILCPGCWHPAAEDAPQCPHCGDYLMDQVVVLVDEPHAAFSARADPGLAEWVGRERGDRRADLSPALAASSVLLGPLVVGDERIAAQTLVISRVIELAPAVSEAALHRWWRAHSSRAFVDVGDDQLQLGPPVHRPGDGSLCHMSGDLRRRHRWPSVHLQLELTPWSSSRSELSLRPRRRLRNVTRYFCAGQATLDQMAADLIDLAAA